MRTIVLILALLLLAGCSGDDEPAPAPREESMLTRTCPQLERALQDVDPGDAASLRRAAERVRGLGATGDRETRDAVRAVVRGLHHPRTWMDTLGGLASTCAAAGAPVFH